MKVVGGQVLAGLPAKLLLITSASTASSQAVGAPLHIFTCFVVNLADAPAQVLALCVISNLSHAANTVSTVSNHQHCNFPEARSRLY